MPGSNFAEVRTTIIQRIIQLVREKYVYPEAGNEIACRLQAKLEDDQASAVMISYRDGRPEVVADRTG